MLKLLKPQSHKQHSLFDQQKLIAPSKFTTGVVYDYILMDNHSSVVYTSGEFSMPVDYTGKETSVA